MAAKKFYGVRKGKITGVFNTWEACRQAVEGYPGAQYKGFSTLEEAKEYLGDLYCLRFQAETAQAPSEKETPDVCGKPGEAPCGSGKLLAYVDGSYSDALKKYAFGCVFLLPDGRVFTACGNGDNAQSLAQRNVTGEMLGAMYAVKAALCSGFRELELRYDYAGIEKWVTGEWKARTELTAKYAAAMREWGSRISLSFTKVAAHTNVYYNELADKMAKAGLKSGNGVPKVRRIEEMDEYHGTDEAE